MEKKKVLIVDDEQDLCEILQFNLVSAGYDADVACSAEDAVSKGMGQYDQILLNVMMPGLSGFDLARQLKADSRTSHVPIIFMAYAAIFILFEDYDKHFLQPFDEVSDWHLLLFSIVVMLLLGWCSIAMPTGWTSASAVSSWLSETKCAAN